MQLVATIINRCPPAPPKYNIGGKQRIKKFMGAVDKIMHHIKGLAEGHFHNVISGGVGDDGFCQLI